LPSAPIKLPQVCDPESSVPKKRKILVTSALPYANNSLHIGHLVEYIQTDIWVRFQRLRGHDCIYVCASDAHGTPTMLRAEERRMSPAELLAEVAAEHERDFGTYSISVDNYLTTDAPENRELTELMYARHVEGGLVTRRSIEQAFDEEKKMFLPDRYVRGTCPVCGTPDQYGDSCESCSATYSPLDLVDAVSVVSGTSPTARESEHLFFRLGEFEDELRDWVPKHVDPTLARKLDEWFEQGLKDWDISRDEPYFGFRVPEEAGKFFYVWFDAPIGYMASFLHLCRSRGIDFDEYWKAGSDIELYHFIGKDILYFHALFWPAMLQGAGFRRPTHIFVHGFLTVDHQKMSKRRGTFITAGHFATHLDPEYLRYYFASKLGPAPDDLDLSPDDFVAKVNADLVGKLVNIASRCSGFVHKLNAGRLGVTLSAQSLFNDFAEAGVTIAESYESRNFAKAVRQIMVLADQANQYIDEMKPWIQAKDAAKRGAVVDVCTLGLNLFRALIVYLKPILPGLAARSEAFLQCGPLQWSDAAVPLLDHDIAQFEPLIRRVEPADVEAALNQPRDETGPASADAADSDDRQMIDIDQFMGVDLRVAQILEADYVDGADKLLKLKLDVGDSTRVVFSGIRKAYEPAMLIGRHVVLVANLKARKMRFGTSEGMILAAGGSDGHIFLLSPDSGAQAGMRVT
jgi:methionyl-tRNA synthetase